MPAKKYLSLPSTGIPTEVQATVTSAGAANDGDIVALGTDGLLSTTIMPVGIGAATIVAPSSENLAAGDLVNFWNDAGTLKVRKADASTASAGKEAHGFVLTAVTSPASATVYTGQGSSNTGVSGLTAGSRYFLSGTTAGAITTTAPTTAGHLVQLVGVATAAANLLFNPQIQGIRA